MDGRALAASLGAYFTLSPCARFQPRYEPVSSRTLSNPAALSALTTTVPRAPD